MKETLEKQLGSAFKFMVKLPLKNSDFIDDLYSAFGCECRDGWYDLIYNLCDEISGLYLKYEIEPNITVNQVKEKFGTLRFYYSIPSDTDINLVNEIEEVVDKYYRMSEVTCEVCGQQGKLRQDTVRWEVLCDSCFMK
ncbi:hypothetical protein [Streptococcus fryi]